VPNNGHQHTAKWWTRGDQPDIYTGDGKPWNDNGPCSGGGGGGGNPSPSTSPTPNPSPTTSPTGGGGTGQYPAWQAGHAYAAGDLVSYNGRNYRCIQAHTSQVGWEPPNVPALWAAA
jgi:chitodextrinase